VVVAGNSKWCRGFRDAVEVLWNSSSG
jgi:hypothetical protein